MSLLDEPIYEGTAVPVTCTFAPYEGGPPTDPTTVTLKFWVNAGPTTTWVYLSSAIVRVSDGVYSATLDTTGAPGFWALEWIGTLASAAADIARFEVLPLPR